MLLSPMRLDQFSNDEFDRGASRLAELIWLIFSGLFVNTWLPGSNWRRFLLRAFGAKIGVGVIIKPHVKVKFPWRLIVGDYTWIGEYVWIDNLADVTIGSNSCLSQGSYLCTGSHDWNDSCFALITKPIIVEDSCWLGAFSRLAPGTVVEKGAILTLGTVGRGKMAGGAVHSGSLKLSSRPR